MSSSESATHGTDVIGENVKMNSMGFPIREGVQTCRFFGSSGPLCTYKSKCTFNHPEEIAQKRQVKAREIERRNAEKKNTTVSQSDKDMNRSDLKLNSVGLPLRPGEPPCEHYMTSGGYCKFQSNCKYDHPEDACGPRKAKQKAKAATTDSDGVKEHQTQSAEKFARKTKKPSSAEKCEKTDVDSVLASLTLNAHGFPVRPGKEDCRDYVRSNGECKRRLACPFNHPALPAGAKPAREEAEDDAPLNSVGLPLRKDADTCLYFVQTKGHCKRKSKCPYNHPEEIAVERVKKIFDRRTRAKGTGSSTSSENETDDEHGQQTQDRHPSKSKTVRQAGDEDGFQPVSKKSGNQRNKKEQQVVTYNSMGYPMRPNAEECQFYVNSLGSCKHGRDCRYNHPEWVAQMKKEEEQKLQKSKSGGDASVATKPASSINAKQVTTPVKHPEAATPTVTAQPTMTHVSTKQDEHSQLPDEASLNVDVNRLLVRAGLEPSKAPFIAQGVALAGAKRKVSEANLPLLAKVFGDLGMPLPEVRSLCKHVFDMRKEELMKQQ